MNSYQITVRIASGVYQGVWGVNIRTYDIRHAYNWLWKNYGQAGRIG